MTLFDPPATVAAKKLALEMPFEERRVARGDYKLGVRDYTGQGETFVCLHGFPDNLHIFDQLAPCLAKAGHRVVSVDFLGYGGSDKPEGFKYGFKAQEDDILAVLDGLGIEKANIVGHDAGGAVAVNFALDHADRVSGLTLLNCFFADGPALKLPELVELFALPALRPIAMATLQDPTKLQWILGIQRTGFGKDLSDEGKELMTNILQPQIAENFTKQPSSGPAFAAMTAQAHPYATANAARVNELKRIDVPVTLAWGKRDPYLTTDLAKVLAAQFKSASLDFVDAGHWPQIELPHETAALILRASQDG